MNRFILILALSATLASLAACGVKNDLMRPNGQPTPAGQDDPSRPPQPLGR